MPEPLLISCPNCGTANRVPREKISQGLKPVCGKCRNPLPVSQASTSNSEPITVTDASFSRDVEGSPLPVLLDMWAPWCGPCRMISPVVEQIASEMAGRLRVGKMNVDENPVTADRFGIRSIPALLVFKNGREVDRMVGAQPKTEISRRLQRVIAENA